MRETRSISPAESNDRRLPVEAAPLAECPRCESDELMRVGLELACASCGNILRPLEDAA